MEHNKAHILTYKIVAILVSVFIIVYVLFQVINTFYQPFDTIVIQKDTYSHLIDVEGFFTREEVLLKDSYSGVLDFNFENGEKISKGSVVATVYSKEEDIINLEKIKDLEEKKEILVKSQDKSINEKLQVDLVNKKIKSAKLDLVKQNEGNLINGISDIYDTLLLNLNRLDAFYNKEINFDEQIKKIESDIKSIKSLVPQSKKQIKSNISGYFSNVVDGYEEVLTPDIMKSLDVFKVKEILFNKTEIGTTEIGKVITGNNIYFVFPIDKKTIYYIEKSNNLKIRFQAYLDTQMFATVEHVINHNDTDDAVVIIRINNINDETSNIRFSNAVLEIDSYNGIIIPKEAVRVKNIHDKTTGEVREGVKGVYTIYGDSVDFREIDTLFEDNKIIISRENNNNYFVKNYDEVIVKGKILDKMD